MYCFYLFIIIHVSCSMTVTTILSEVFYTRVYFIVPILRFFCVKFCLIASVVYKRLLPIIALWIFDLTAFRFDNGGQRRNQIIHAISQIFEKYFFPSRTILFWSSAA